MGRISCVVVARSCGYNIRMADILQDIEYHNAVARACKHRDKYGGAFVCNPDGKWVVWPYGVLGIHVSRRDFPAPPRQLSRRDFLAPPRQLTDAEIVESLAIAAGSDA